MGYGGQDDNIDKLLAERQQAKAEKNFARADEIRDELLSQGVEIEDTPGTDIFVCSISLRMMKCHLSKVRL